VLLVERNRGWDKRRRQRV